MKRRNISKDFLLSVLFCALVAALTCSSAYAATVTTDRLDYAPYEVVIITGSGWEPGETVSIFLHEDPVIDPDVGPDSYLDPSPVADLDGNIYAEFVIQPNDVGVTFTLTATGLYSGLIAQTTFTDGNINVQTNASGITFDAAWEKWSSSNCTGTVSDSGTWVDVGNTNGTQFHKGAGNTESISITAEALSDQGGVFINWTAKDTDGTEVDPDLPTTNLTICVPGFTGGGSRLYIANYSSGVCGNGILETGEQCDDGAANGTVGSCCDSICDFKANGTSCNDGDLCTQTDTCQSGACTGSNPVICTALDQCHDAGTCNSSTGICSNPNKPDGSACNDEQYCTVDDQCTSGACGGSPRDCSDGLSCTTDTCNEGMDRCDHPIDAGTCLISGTCYNNNNNNPANECQACIAGTSQTDFTNKTTGTLCGSSSDTDCDNPDTCNGSGVCQPNYEAADTPCTDEGSPCTSDLCDGVGVCQHEGPEACSAVTNSSLCPFDVYTNTDVSDLRLIFTPDMSATVSKLNASNPGQFYYNVFDGSGDGNTLTIDIPYPFVTQGAVPIHVYDSATMDDNGCWTPGNLVTGCMINTTGGHLSPSGAPVIMLGDYASGFGATTAVSVDCPVPSTGFLYVALHLDYGLKGTVTGCTKSYPNYPDTSVIDASCTTPTNTTIDDQKEYVFNNSISSDSVTIQSLNTFKKDPGIGGLVLQYGTNNPVPNVEVQIYDSSNKLLATVKTDQDGWYMWAFKYTGKAATFTVKLPDYKQQPPQRVTLKSNGFVVVTFTLP